VSGTGFMGTGGENRFEDFVECEDGGDGETIRTLILELLVWVELLADSREISTELGMSFDSGVKLFLRILGLGGFCFWWFSDAELVPSDKTRLDRSVKPVDDMDLSEDFTDLSRDFCFWYSRKLGEPTGLVVSARRTGLERNFVRGLGTGIFVLTII
jgi:hypothetical protein